MLVLKLIFVQVFAVVITTGAESSWSTLLKQYQKWEGLYHYDSTNASCFLVVHSLNYVTFTSGKTSTDMKVSSDDNVTVTFTTESVWSHPVHKVGDTHLEFVGQFLSYGSKYYYVGNVSLEFKHIGTVLLTPSVSYGWSNSDTRLRYGLAIGIPLLFFILLMISSVLILRWGIKKGYLRHVPMAYKRFINSRRERTDYEMNYPEISNKIEKPESHI